jgi:hypothetical protein
MPRKKVGWKSVVIGSLTETPPRAPEPTTPVKRRRRKIPKTQPIETPRKELVASKAPEPKPRPKRDDPFKVIECPVCRSVDRCGCSEDDRTFIRRMRFEGNVEKVAKCSICQSPLSVAYVRRPGIDTPPYELSEFYPIWCCASCSPEAFATVIIRANL